MAALSTAELAAMDDLMNAAMFEEEMMNEDAAPWEDDYSYEPPPPPPSDTTAEDAILEVTLLFKRGTIPRIRAQAPTGADLKRAIASYAASPREFVAETRTLMVAAEAKSMRTAKLLRFVGASSSASTSSDGSYVPSSVAMPATLAPAEASAAATTAIIVAFFADAVAAGYSEDAMRTTFECGLDDVAAAISTTIVKTRAQNSSGTDAQIDAWIVNKYKDKVAAATAAYAEQVEAAAAVAKAEAAAAAKAAADLLLLTDLGRENEWVQCLRCC
jgi:hypothetical protein